MHFFRGSALKYWASGGLPDNATYFSAGVMLLNSELWRSRGIVDRLRRWTSENSERMAHLDQSVLNALLHDDMHLLLLRWNLQTPLIDPITYGWGGTQELHNAVQSPGIVHFVTARKPWRREFRVPMSEYYWKYRDMLGWENQKPALSAGGIATRCREECQHLARLLRTAARRQVGRIPEPR